MTSHRLSRDGIARLRVGLLAAVLALSAMPAVAEAQGAPSASATLARDVLMTSLPVDYDRRICARLTAILDPLVRQHAAAIAPRIPAADAKAVVDAIVVELDAVCRDAVEAKRKAAVDSMIAAVSPDALAALDRFYRTPAGAGFANAARAGSELIYFGDFAEGMDPGPAVRKAVEAATATMSAEDRDALGHAFEDEALVAAMAGSRTALEQNGFLLPNEELTPADEARLEAAGRRAARARPGGDKK